MATISIIVPIYNVEKYIKQCIDSLTNQTYKDIEIICVDDRGTDNSIKIAKNLAKTDPRIKIIQHKKNSGLSASRNTGIKNSSAPYIMFCDSDDWYQPDMCEKMLNAIKHNNVDLAMCGVNVIYETNANLKKHDKSFTLKENGVFNIDQNFLTTYKPGMPFKIFKRKIIQKYNLQFPEGLKYEDLYFFNVYCLRAKKIYLLTDKLYNYRRRPNSIMNKSFSGTTNASLDMVKIAINYFNYIKANNLYKKQFDYFWSKLFIRCVRTSLTFTKSNLFKDEIFNLCRQFIYDNYDFNNKNTETTQIIKSIVDKKFMTYQKRFGGLIYEYNDGIKHNYLLFKICSVFKSKITEQNKKKYYILNIRIA